MSEWKETTVGHICKVKGGKRLPAGKEFAEGVTPFPYLRVTDMVNGSIDQASLVYAKPEIEPFIRNYKISKDNLYVTIAGTLGLFGTIPDNLDNAQLTENAAKLCEIDFSEFNKYFLKYYFNSEIIQTQIRREIGVGGGVPKLALFRIEKLKVKYPEKKMQDRIAYILSTCDSVIEKTQAAIAKYKAIKQGMLHDLFTRGIDITTGKLRPKYEDAPELYKESKLGMVPREWEIKKLGEYSFITKLAGFEYTLHFDYSKSGPIIAVRALNIKHGKLDLENIHTIPKETSDILPRSQLKKGDLVISYVGTVGEVAVIPENNKFHLAPNVAKISVDINEINPFYLNQFLNADVGQNEIIKLISSTTQAALSMQNMREVQFIKPDLNEQRLITKQLENIDNNIDIEQTYLHKLQSIKQGLMADLLSGKKRVILPEEELKVLK